MLQDCFCYKPFPHVFLVLTLFLLFNKLLLITTLLSETLLLLLQANKDAPLTVLPACAYSQTSSSLPAVRAGKDNSYWPQRKMTEGETFK